MASCNKEIFIESNSSDEKVEFSVKVKNEISIDTKVNLKESVQYLGADIKGYLVNENGETYKSFSIRNGGVYGDPIYLYDENLTLYTFWNSGQNISDFSVIPISISDNIDYLYGTHVIGINKRNPSAEVTLNHILSCVKVTINNLTDRTVIVKSLSIRSKGIAKTSTFDLTSLTNDGFTGIDEYIQIINGPSLGTSYYTNSANGETFIIPTGEASAITIQIESEDGSITEVETPEILFEKGVKYCYTLNIKAQTVQGFTFDETNMPWKTENVDMPNNNVTGI